MNHITQQLTIKAYLFKSQSVNWSINSRFANKEVMIDDRDVILSELYVYPG